MYMVYGGIYTDTDFETLDLDTEEEYGPFDTYEEAFDKWRAATGLKVDVCCHRLRILKF